MDLLFVSAALTALVIQWHLCGVLSEGLDKAKCPWKHIVNRDFVAPSYINMSAVSDPQVCKDRCVAVERCYTIRYDKTDLVCRLSFDRLDGPVIINTEYRPTTDIYYLNCTGQMPEHELLGVKAEYLALIGMGVLVILLVITAVVSIFTLSGNHRK